MKPHAITNEQLFAYADGAGEAIERAVLADHLASCAECSATLARYRAVADVVRAGWIVEAPAALVATLKSLLPRTELQPFSEAADRLAPVRNLRRIVARLLLDTRVAAGTPAFAGLRAGSGPRRVRYALDDVGGELDLQLEPARHERADRWLLIGQIEIDEPATVTVALHHTDGSDPIVQTASDESGLFECWTAPGRYDLWLSFADTIAVVRNLEIG